MILLERISEGISQLGLSVNLEAKKKLVEYLELLSKWNRAYNLTSVRDVNDMVTRHILDSLIIAPYLYGERIIDIGSGAGLPGIPLSILDPKRQFVLLDSNGKKIRFLMQAKQELALTNVTIIEARAEAFLPEKCFESVLSRAFASLKEMLTLTQHLSCKEGRFIAMKGAYPTEELQEIPPHFKVEGVHPLQVPGLDAKRHVVCLSFGE